MNNNSTLDFKVKGFFFKIFFQDLPAFLKNFPICSFLQDTADMTNRAQEHFNISQSLDKQPKVRAISCQALDNFNYHSAANHLHFIHNSAASIVNKRLTKKLIYFLFTKWSGVTCE